MLMRKCDLIITDSGGIQEEATAPAIRKPVLVMRLSTERPEAVETGFAKVVGIEKNAILSAMKATLTSKRELPEKSPFGDGCAAERTVEIIKKEFAMD
jgi:UDP-N-acetylglucosamine 2-epimerase (non-hydrolysing)